MLWILVYRTRKVLFRDPFFFFTNSPELLNYSIRFLLNFRMYSSLRYRRFKRLLRPRYAPPLCVCVCAHALLIPLSHSYSVHSVEMVLRILSLCGVITCVCAPWKDFLIGADPSLSWPGPHCFC